MEKREGKQKGATGQLQKRRFFTTDMPLWVHVECLIIDISLLTIEGPSYKITVAQTSSETDSKKSIHQIWVFGRISSKMFAQRTNLSFAEKIGWSWKALWTNSRILGSLFGQIPKLVFTNYTRHKWQKAISKNLGDDCFWLVKHCDKLVLQHQLI